MVEAGVLPVESTVDQLSTHVSVLVERWLSCQLTAFESGSGSAAATCVRMWVEAGVLSVESTADWLRPRVPVFVEVTAVL